MIEKKYDIGGKTYIQKPLVLGQLRQLLAVLKEVEIPADANVPCLIDVLGAHLPDALAVILNPEGISPRDKELGALADEIEFTITPEQIFEVVDDFFGCNPLPSLLDRVGVAAEAIKASMSKTESRPWPSSSPEEISPAAMKSCGDSPMESADPGSIGGNGKPSSGKP